MDRAAPRQEGVQGMRREEAGVVEEEVQAPGDERDRGERPARHAGHAPRRVPRAG